MLKQLNWGLVGTGCIASDFLQAIAHTPRSRAVNVVGSTPAKASAFARWGAIPHWSATLPELLADETVDAVYVAHILPDDVRMLTVTADAAAFRQFLYVQQTSRWLKAHGFKGEQPLIGDAETP